jgi:hypothetical protein
MALDGMQRLGERDALVQTNEPWALPLNLDVMLTAPDTVLPDTAIPVLPVTATLSVGNPDAALAPVTPASAITQAATTLDTTIEDPSRFTKCSYRCLAARRGCPRRKPGWSAATNPVCEPTRAGAPCVIVNISQG